jgi:hypothetical protein
MNAAAQNSGFQGRHFSLNYAVFTSQAFTGPAEGGGSGVFSFNTNHHFNLDAVVARRLSLGASFEYAHTRFSFKERFTDYYTATDEYGSPYTASIKLSSSSTGNIEIYGIGIYPRIFFKGSIAPLGTYFKPEFIVQLVKVYPGNPSYLISTPNYDGPEFVNKSPYLNYMIMLEFGQNRLFFKRLFLDYGFRIGIMPKATKYFDAARNDRTYLEVESMSRISRHMLFNVKAGIGVLLF